MTTKPQAAVADQEQERAPRAVHIMVDLETMGKVPGSVLASIGAVVFDPVAGTYGPSFYTAIDQESCERVGLVKDPATVEWWSTQSEAAQLALQIDARPLADVLADFTTFWKENSGRRLWAHGPSFDETLLSAAYRACGQEPPWDFRDPRDTRTIYELADVSPNRASGTHHNALDDARVQAEAVIAAYSKLGLSLAGAVRAGEAAEEPEWTWKRDDEGTLLCMTMIGVEIPMPPTKPEHVGTVFDHRPAPGAPTLTLETVSTWTDEQQQQVEAYAGAVSAEAGDHEDVEIPPIPAHLAPFLPHSKWNPLGYVRQP